MSRVHTLNEVRTTPPAVKPYRAPAGHLNRPLAQAPYPPTVYPPTTPPNVSVPQPSEVEELRRVVEEQRARIDVLTRTLEHLTLRYQDLSRDVDASKKRDQDTRKRLDKVENAQSEAKREMEQVSYKAEIGYQNSTADDQARQYMYDEREMQGYEDVLEVNELSKRSQQINQQRRNRI